VPYGVITPFIVVISVIGAYAINNQMKDVFICVIFGVVGYWLRKMKYPLAPLVVALVLGDPTERELRKALIGSGGDPFVLIGSPVAATLNSLAVLLLLLPLARMLLSRRRPAAPASVEAPAK
jgi:putative tricarboxylic transport membrane protein